MAKKRAMVSQKEGTLAYLEPESIEMSENTRFGLKQSRVDSIAQSIMEMGGVMVPGEVDELDHPIGDYRYRLTAGAYRLVAILQVNREGAGLLFPAMIVSPANAEERLRRQLTENMERENQTPMDQATAIRQLLDNGVAKMEIRNIFSRPGGRKGVRTQPASNSFINMTLSFLDLPKDTQRKIHEGAVGVAAAYQLTRVPPDKREEVLEKAEKEREAEVKKAEKEEEKFLASEKKGQGAIEKQQDMERDLEVAKETLAKAEKNLADRTELEVAAYKEKASLKPSSAPKKTLEKLNEQFRAAEAEAKTARRAVEVARNAVVKREDKTAKATEVAEAKPEKDKKAKVVKLGPEHIKKAAKQTGASTGLVAPSSKNIRDTFRTLALPPDCKTRRIGKALVRFGAGTTTENQLIEEIQAVVGEVPKSKK